MYSLNTAGFDERYIVYLAPLLLLPAALAVARREVSPAGLAIASVLLAALLLTVPWSPDHGPFGFFVSPVEMFYARVVGLRLSRYLPGDGDDVVTLATLALAVGGVVLAGILHRAPARLSGLPGLALVAAVPAVMLVQTHYTMTKYVNGAGSKAGADLLERAFVDRVVPAGATVGEFAGGIGQRPEYIPMWQEVQFYNQRIDTVLAVDANVNQVPIGDGLAVVSYDRRTGRAALAVDRCPITWSSRTLIGGPRPRGDAIVFAEHIPIGVIRAAKPAVLAWDASGFEDRRNAADRSGGDCSFLRHRAPTRAPLRDVRPVRSSRPTRQVERPARGPDRRHGQDRSRRAVAGGGGAAAARRARIHRCSPARRRASAPGPLRRPVLLTARRRASPD